LTDSFQTTTQRSSKLSFIKSISNTVFLTQDSETLCYDRKTPNGKFRLRERVALSLPSQPKVVPVNVFDLNNAESNDQKVAYLQQTVPLVAPSVQAF